MADETKAAPSSERPAGEERRPGGDRPGGDRPRFGGGRGPGGPPREAATEPECEIIAFSAPARGGYGGMHGGGEPGITRVTISPRMRLADAIKQARNIALLPFAGRAS